MMEGPWCRFRREARAREDIDTVLVDRLKALDPNRPIREADILQPHRLRDLKVVCIGQPTPFRRVSLFAVAIGTPPAPPELVASTFSWAAVAYHAALLTSETKPQPYFFS